MSCWIGTMDETPYLEHALGEINYDAYTAEF